MIEFNGEKHEYILDGEKIPSVSELINIYSDTETDEYVEAATEYARERGTECHRYLEQMLKGIITDDSEEIEDYYEYYDAIDKFLEEHTIEVIETEQIVTGEINEVKYGGTLDCIGILDGETTLIDWKFVSQVQKYKVGAQINFYREALRQSGIYIEKMKIVQFLPGKYRIYKVQTNQKGMKLAAEVYKAKKMKQPKGEITQ